MPSIYRAPTEIAFGWLKFCHRQFRIRIAGQPLVTSSLLTRPGAATTTIGIAMARRRTRPSSKRRVRRAYFLSPLHRQSPPVTVSVSSSNGEGARTTAAIKARSRTFVGHTTITGPTERHDQAAATQPEVLAVVMKTGTSPTALHLSCREHYLEIGRGRRANRDSAVAVVKALLEQLDRLIIRDRLAVFSGLRRSR